MILSAWALFAGWLPTFSQVPASLAWFKENAEIPLEPPPGCSCSFQLHRLTRSPGPAWRPSPRPSAPAPRLDNLPQRAPHPAGLAPFLTATGGSLCRKIPTTLNQSSELPKVSGTRDPQTLSWWLSKPQNRRRSGSPISAHHHLADRLPVCDRWPTVSHNFGIGHSIRRFLELHNPPQGTTVSVARLVPVIRAL